MPMDEKLLREIGRQFQKAQRILVASHIRPDGDAVGSLLGLGLSLQAAGKDVQMVLADGVPVSYRHLEGSDQIRYNPEGAFDLFCVLDCSDISRVGFVLNGSMPPYLNLDHHVTNLNFAKINLVDTTAVASAEIVADLLAGLNLPFTQAVIDALLTGLITDTLGFRTSNMTPKALREAADLMERGANLPELYRRSLLQRSFEAVRYWGAGLSNLERDGRLVWATLTLADRKAIGYPGRDDADLINVLSSIEEADIAIIFVEQPNGKTKVSWRSQPGIDVSQVAVKFGGGGHPSASGAEIEGSLEEVRSAVLQSTRLILEDRYLTEMSSNQAGHEQIAN